MANPSNHIAAAAASIALVGAFGAGAFALSQDGSEFDPKNFVSAYSQGANDQKDGYQANQSDTDAQANRHDNGEENNQADSSKNSDKANNVPLDGASGTTALRVSADGSADSGLVAGNGNGNGSQDGTGNGATGPVIDPSVIGGDADNGNSSSDSNAGNNNGGSTDNNGGNGENNNPGGNTGGYDVLPQDPTPEKESRLDDSFMPADPVNKDGLADGVGAKDINDAGINSFAGSYQIYKGQKLDPWSIFCAINTTITVKKDGEARVYQFYCASKEEFESYPYFKISYYPPVAPDEPFTITVAYRFDSNGEWTYKDLEIEPADTCTFIVSSKLDESGNPICLKEDYDPTVNLLEYTEKALESLDAINESGQATTLILNWKENGKPVSLLYRPEPGRHVIQIGDTAPVPDGCNVSPQMAWLDGIDGLCYLQTLTTTDSDSPVYSLDEDDLVTLTVPDGIQSIDASTGDRWIYADKIVIPACTLNINATDSAFFVAKRYVVDGNNQAFSATDDGILTNKAGDEYLGIPLEIPELVVPEGITKVCLPNASTGDDTFNKVIIEAASEDTIPEIEFSPWEAHSFVIKDDLLGCFANKYHDYFAQDEGNVLSIESEPDTQLYYKDSFMRTDDTLYTVVDSNATSLSADEGVHIRKGCFANNQALNTLLLSGNATPTFEEGCFEGSNISEIICASEEQRSNVEQQLAASGISDVEAIVMETSQEGYSYFDDGDDITILKAPDGVEEFTGVITAADGTQLKATALYPDLFANCDSLKWAILDESVTSIGDRAFYSCPNLQGIFVSNKDTVTFGESAYANCDSIRFVASRAKNASFATYDTPNYGQCILWCLDGAEGYYFSYFDKSVVDDFQISKVCDGDYALYACQQSNPFILLGVGNTMPSGSTLALDKNIVQIWAATFKDIETDYTINWEDLANLAFINDDVFHITDPNANSGGINGKVTINVPDQNAEIGDTAFAHSNITAFESKAKWLSLGMNAFSYSPNLKTVKIDAEPSDPSDENAVTHLYSNTFDGCNALTTIELTSAKPMELILQKDTSVKAPFRFNAELSQEEEAQQIYLKVPEGSEQAYIDAWIYRFAGYADYDEMRTAVARQLYVDSDYQTEPTEDEIRQAVSDQLLPVENRMRTMMHIDQVEKTTVALPDANSSGDIDYGDDSKGAVDPGEATDPGSGEGTSTGDESAKEEKPGSDNEGSGTGTNADASGTSDTDAATKPDSPSGNEPAAGAGSTEGTEATTKPDNASSGNTPDELNATSTEKASAE